MASLNLTADELKSLESVRSRLFQLSNSIGSLHQDVFRSNPLPSTASLQASASILQQNLASLVEVTRTHADLFQRVAVHPSTNFPGRAQEGVLQTLLRKKPEPEVQGAAERARGAAAAAGVNPTSFAARAPAADADRRRRNAYGDVDSDDEEGYVGESDDDGDDDDGDDDDARGPGEPAGYGDVWAAAREWCGERVARFVREEAADAYTAEERAREGGVRAVRTGLRRELESEDESEDEDEDEDEDMAEASEGTVPGAAPGAAPTGAVGTAMEVVMWAAARGDMNAPAYLTAQPKR